jgi:hypothetical protein
MTIKERERLAPTKSLESFTASWSKDNPEEIVFSNRNLGKSNCLFAIDELSAETADILSTSTTLQVDFGPPDFYTPSYQAKLSNPVFREKEMTDAGDGLFYRLELWIESDDSLFEMSEVLFNGRRGKLRVFLENRSEELKVFKPALLHMDIPGFITQHNKTVFLPPSKQGEIIYGIDVAENAEAGLYKGEVNISIGDTDSCISEEFELGIYHLYDFESQISQVRDKALITLRCKGVVKTPFGFFEHIKFSQNISLNAHSNHLALSTHVTDFSAVAYFSKSQFKENYVAWGQPVSSLLLSNYYSFSSFARTVFGIATAAVAGGFAALGAAAAKAALSALLVIVLSPLLSPGATLIIGLFILTVGFETWWATFLTIAVGMTGREVNQAIWDKMGDAPT